MVTWLFLLAYGISAAVLLYVYWLYLLLLRVLAGVARPKQRGSSYTPRVTVLLTVHNEERLVRQRLDNLLALTYPQHLTQILVASDGSTDRTNSIVREYEDIAGVVLLEFDRLGKSEAQNAAVQKANGNIIIFTDAPCTFEPDFIEQLVQSFSDPCVGCVTANLRFNTSPTAVAQNQGYYWSYELKLRRLESSLGILAVATGAAMAVRKECFYRLDSNVGEDCSLPLDVVLNGFSVVHNDLAHAWDTMESDAATEFKARVRMTMRNWTGTWQRSELLNPLRHPGYAFALWSHKLLRWLSPVFIIVMVLASIPLVEHPLFWPLPLLVGGLLFAGFLGWMAERSGKTIPLMGTVWSFLLANAGFLVGVLLAVSGRSVVTYTGRKPAAT